MLSMLRSLKLRRNALNFYSKTCSRISAHFSVIYHFHLFKRWKNLNKKFSFWALFPPSFDTHSMSGDSLCFDIQTGYHKMTANVSAFLTIDLNSTTKITLWWKITSQSEIWKLFIDSPLELLYLSYLNHFLDIDPLIWWQIAI